MFGWQVRAALLVSITTVALTMTPAVAAPLSWKTFLGERFGAAADVPTKWKMGNAPYNDDGRNFFSPDGKASLLVYGSFELGDDLFANSFITAHEGETITYRVHKDSLLVVSGTEGNVDFYKKSLLTCGRNIWVSVQITYPTVERAVYKPLVEHVASSLHQTKRGYEGCPRVSRI